MQEEIPYMKASGSLLILKKYFLFFLEEGDELHQHLIVFIGGLFWFFCI